MPGHTEPVAFRWSIPTRVGDTDPYGVVYFVSYFRFMKEALDEFLRARGLVPEDIYRDSEAGRGLPVAASSARFLRPARYGDTLEIRVTVGTFSEKSVRFDFQIGRRPGGEPVATGEITCVAIDANWRSIGLPQEWRERLSGAGDPPWNLP